MISRDKKNIEMKNDWAIGRVDIELAHEWVYNISRSILWKRYIYWKRFLRLPEILKTIETGCGYGKFSMLLGLNGEDVSLLDYNDSAIKTALYVHNMFDLNPSAWSEDILNPPSHMEGMFDLVCSFGTLEHFAGNNRLNAFKANVKLLKTGGLMFFTVPNRYGIFYRIAFGLRRKLKLVPENFFEKPYSRTALKKLALCSNIKVLELEAIGTLKDDFDYWIMENVKSLYRKILRGKKNRPATTHMEINSKGLDLTGKIPDPRRYLDRLYSYDLLFVGLKK